MLRYAQVIRKRSEAQDPKVKSRRIFSDELARDALSRKDLRHMHKISKKDRSRTDAG